MNFNDINAVDANSASSYTIDFVIPKGATGDPGPEGPTGPAPRIVIGTVTTAPPGTDASVTITPTNP